MSSTDWDRVLFFACFAISVLGLTKVMLVFFTDTKSSETAEGLSPFKAWLNYSLNKDKLQAEFDLERFRIDKNMVPRTLNKE